ANLRGILHHGIGPYLDSLAENRDPLHPILLLEETGQTVRREEAVACLQIILQTLVENYEEYKDYNTTTTLSDYGENLHVLLAFLRAKAAYERQAWLFRPLILIHDVLVRAGKETIASLWEEIFTRSAREIGDQHVADLRRLEQEHGIRLTTVA